MKFILSQVIASTGLDSQGERIPAEHLHRIAELWAGRRMPLHQQHSSDLPSPGYFENIRTLTSTTDPQEILLIADVTYDETRIQDPVGGFSIAFLEPLRHSTIPERFQIFVPFPHYKDEALLNELFEDGFSSVGRVGRKAAEPEYIAIVISTLVAILTPTWTNIWNNRIGPGLSEFFERKFSSLGSRGVGVEVLQHLDHEGRHVELLLIPQRGRETYCFSVGKTFAAMLQTREYLYSLDINHIPARKIFMRFDQSSDLFVMKSVHFTDGSVINM